VALFRSIRWRVQFWHGLLLAVVLGALGLAVWRMEAARREERIDDEIYRRAFLVNAAQRGERAKPAGSASADDDDGRPKRTSASRVPLAQVLSEADLARGFYYVIWRKNIEPRYLASSNAPEGVPRPDAVNDGHRTRGDLREAFINPQPEDYALVGRSIAADRAELRRLALWFAAVGFALWAVLVLSGWWMIGRLLRPVGEIARAAEEIAGGDLSRRIETRDTGSELGRLASVLNNAFARLEAAFAQQGSFTADAAHELRTPVTVILIQVQGALAAGGLTADQREIFQACERAAKRMRGLIESLLQLARLDAGEEARGHEASDLAGLAAESLSAIRPLAETRGIVLEAELRPAPLQADVGCLAQVITNLLTNAIHHNRDGGEVRVAVRAVEGWAELVVADTGVGIAAEHLPHIFERFYRVDKARTSHLGRTGLGLAITRAIVVAHGGTIEVKSTVGVGTTFTVRLPAS
jgi:heavy metal sensor kinase